MHIPEVRREGGKFMPGKKSSQYAVPYTWAELREQIMQEWTPTGIPQLDPIQSRFFNDLWDELTRVNRAQAWRSTTSLAGQTLEALLKQRLIVNGVPSSELSGRHGTMGSVIQRATKEGIFLPPSTSFSISGSVFAAKHMRNMASHASPWHQHPSELRASLSLVSLVCFAGYLFPSTSPPATINEEKSTDDVDWWMENINELSMVSIRRGISKLATRNPQSPLLDIMLNRYMSNASPRSMSGIIVDFRRNGFPISILASAIKGNFVQILMRSGVGRVKNVEQAIMDLPQAGLRGVASKALASILPHDPDALAYLMKRSPVRLQRYLYMCSTADPEVFRSLASIKTMGPLLKHLSSAIRRRSIPLTAACGIAKSLPVKFRDEIYMENREDFLSWSSDETPANSLSIISTFGQSMHFPRDRQNFTEKISLKSNVCDIESLGGVPLRLYQLNLLDKSSCSPIVEAIVKRVCNSDRWDIGQRILWDLATFSSRYRELVINEVEEAVHGSPKVMSEWDYLSLCGTLLILGKKVHAPMELQRASEVLKACVSDPKYDRFRVLRAVLGASVVLPRDRLDVKVAAVLSSILSGVRDTTELSAHLVAAVRAYQ
ncbi:hypothetical protein ACFVGN_05785 [Streptomyces sp. NPDC057757]|uniref:hypothetical protein n=1 Tax=Streptomyces sp. NPDC057757 TaxID=3346241 RepID=UPI00368F9274